MIANFIRKLSALSDPERSTKRPVIGCKADATQAITVPRPPPGPPKTAQGPAPQPPKNPWPDERVLCCFGTPGVDDFTIRDSSAGVLINGTNGSGKSSGSGALLARAYLRAGYGCLVLCVKTDEADLWRRYASETGRTDDLIFF